MDCFPTNSMSPLSALVLTLLSAATMFAAAAAAPLEGSNAVDVKINGDPSPYFTPTLNLFSFTNCSNDGRNEIGDRLSYVGNGYSYKCDGPVAYIYDRGPPSKTALVYMFTQISPPVSPGGDYFATFSMWADSACKKPYNFLSTGLRNEIFQLEDSCRIYTPDLYNPTAVVSASVLSAAPHLSALPFAATLAIAAVAVFLQKASN